MSTKGVVTRGYKGAFSHSLQLIIILLIVSNVFCVVKVNSLQKQINTSGLKKEQVEVMIEKAIKGFSVEYTDRLADTLEGFTSQINRRFDTVNANIDILVKNVNNFNETVSNLRNALK